MRTHQQFAPKEEVEVDQSTQIQNVQQQKNKINLHHTQKRTTKIRSIRSFNLLYFIVRVCVRHSFWMINSTVSISIFVIENNAIEFVNQVNNINKNTLNESNVYFEENTQHNKKMLSNFYLPCTLRKPGISQRFVLLSFTPILRLACNRSNWKYSSRECINCTCYSHFAHSNLT